MEEEVAYYQRLKELIEDKIYPLTKLKGDDAKNKFFSSESMKKFARAFTHITFSEDDYDNYEFFGDRILEKILSEMILTQFPESTKSEWTSMKSELVKGDTFVNVGMRFQLLGLIRSRSISDSYKYHLVGDVIESIFAALYYICEKEFGFGMGDVVTRHVAYAMFKNEVKDLEVKKNPDVTTITQLIKQLTGKDLPDVENISPVVNGVKTKVNGKYKFSFTIPRDIIDTLLKNYNVDLVGEKIISKNGLYKNILEHPFINSQNVLKSEFTRYRNSFENVT